jgi:hypothetical protein
MIAQNDDAHKMAWEVVPEETADEDLVPSQALSRRRFSFQGFRSRGGG